MFVQDKIADMLTRIRNANIMRYQTVEVVGTKMTLGIAEILKREGYIEDFNYEKNTTGDKLLLTLKYGAKKRKSYHWFKKNKQIWLTCLCSSFRNSSCTKWIRNCNYINFKRFND